MTILFNLLEYLHYLIFLRSMYWLSIRKIAFLGVRWEFVKDSILVNWYWFNHICMLWSKDELGYYVLYYVYFPLKTVILWNLWFGVRWQVAKHVHICQNRPLINHRIFTHAHYLVKNSVLASLYMQGQKVCKLNLGGTFCIV